MSLIVNNGPTVSDALNNAMAWREGEAPRIGGMTTKEAQTINNAIRKAAKRHLTRFGAGAKPDELAQVESGCWEILAEEKGGDYAPQYSTVQYLNRVVIRQSGEIARKRKRALATQPFELCEVAGVGIQPVELLIQRENRSQIAFILREFSEVEREVVMAFHVEGVSVAEIARRSGHSGRSVRRMVTNATCRLRRLMREAGFS